MVTAKMVDRLGDGAVVRCASRLLGGSKGKKKKMAKRATEDEQCVTDASSSEANAEAASGFVEKMTKRAGWSKEWAKRFEEMTEEQEEEITERICSKLRAQVGVGTEQMIEELGANVSEQMRIAEDRRRNEKRDEENMPACDARRAEDTIDQLRRCERS